MMLYRRCRHILMEVPQYLGFVLQVSMCFCPFPLVNEKFY